MHNRTPLEKKYKAVKLLSASQRMWGNRIVPRFREVARELDMKPQNLTTIWQNREAIEIRANRNLSHSQISKIDEDEIKQVKKRANQLLSKHENDDYSKMKVDKLIEAIDDIFEGLFLTLNR